MAQFSFTNRTTRMQMAASASRSSGITASKKVTDAPRPGPVAFKYQMWGGINQDYARYISIDNSEGEGRINPQNPTDFDADCIYYNDTNITDARMVYMDVYVNGFYRSSIEFAAQKIGEPFGYSLTVQIENSPKIASDDALFSDYQAQGVFAEGEVHLTIPSVIIATPLPTFLPPATPEPTEVLPPPTPAATEMVFETPVPTSTEIPGPTPEPTPGATPAATPAATPEPTASGTP
jgi:hypothetical protein